jgi:alpha-glucosidase
MPWLADDPQMGFTTGTPWLPLAAEHRGLSVEDQWRDPHSTLSFARAIIALRQSTPALRLGAIEFLEAAWPVMAFVRRYEGASVACVFNLSGEPQVAADPAFADAELLEIGTGEADLRGESVGLSPYAAAFLRLV